MIDTFFIYYSIVLSLWFESEVWVSNWTLVLLLFGYCVVLIYLNFIKQDLQLNAPLIYFWYAETELSNSSGNSSESLKRAIHILSCLGSGVSYNPFKCQPSSLQLLRAHQGFKERIRMLRTTWARGIINDSSTALICSAALFEELTTGWVAAVEVLDHAFSMVLPGHLSFYLQMN